MRSKVLRLCRVCLTKEENEPFEPILKDDCTVANELFYVSGIIVLESTHFPAIICAKCVADLSTAAKLKRSSVAGELFFKNLTKTFVNQHFEDFKKEIETPVQIKVERLEDEVLNDQFESVFLSEPNPEDASSASDDEDGFNDVDVDSDEAAEPAGKLRIPSRIHQRIQLESKEKLSEKLIRAVNKALEESGEDSRIGLKDIRVEVEAGDGVKARARCLNCSHMICCNWHKYCFQTHNYRRHIWRCKNGDFTRKSKRISESEPEAELETAEKAEKPNLKLEDEKTSKEKLIRIANKIWASTAFRARVTQKLITTDPANNPGVYRVKCLRCPQWFNCYQTDDSFQVENYRKHAKMHAKLKNLKKKDVDLIPLKTVTVKLEDVIKESNKLSHALNDCVFEDDLPDQSENDLNDTEELDEPKELDDSTEPDEPMDLNDSQKPDVPKIPIKPKKIKSNESKMERMIRITNGVWKTSPHDFRVSEQHFKESNKAQGLFLVQCLLCQKRVSCYETAYSFKVHNYKRHVRNHEKEKIKREKKPRKSPKIEVEDENENEVEAEDVIEERLEENIEEIIEKDIKENPVKEERMKKEEDFKEIEPEAIIEEHLSEFMLDQDFNNQTIDFNDTEDLNDTQKPPARRQPIEKLIKFVNRAWEKTAITARVTQDQITSDFDNKPGVHRVKCLACPQWYNVYETRYTFRVQNYCRHVELRHSYDENIELDSSGVGDKRRQKQPPLPKVFCEVCGELVSSGRTFKKHMLRHSQRINCIVEGCDKNFAFKKELAAHVETEHEFKLLDLNAPPGERFCHFCMKNIAARHFRNHIRVHKNILENRNYSCDYCGYKNPDKKNLSNHMRKHHRSKESLMLDEFGNFRFTCDDCGLVFISASKLRQHFEGVHAEKVICESCGQLVGPGDTLKVHMRKHGPLLKCDVEGCGKEFANSSKLSWHKASKHEPENPVGCPYCGKEFSNERKVTKHVSRTHKAVEVPCSVPNCAFKTKRKDLMTIHYTKHKDIDEKFRKQLMLDLKQIKMP